MDKYVLELLKLDFNSVVENLQPLLKKRALESEKRSSFNKELYLSIQCEICRVLGVKVFDIFSLGVSNVGAVSPLIEEATYSSFYKLNRNKDALFKYFFHRKEIAKNYNSQHEEYFKNLLDYSNKQILTILNSNISYYLNNR